MGVKVREKIKGSGDYWIFINHRRVRKARHIGSKKLADKAKAIFEARLKLGQSIEDEARAAGDTPSIPTLDAYFERFKKTLEGSVRESTRDCYEGRYNNGIRQELGGLHLDQITRERVEEFASSLVGRRLANGSNPAKDTIRLTGTCQ
jgi:integrase